MSQQEDWNQYFKEHQHLDEHLFEQRLSKDVLDLNPTPYWLMQQRNQQYRIATGLGTCALLTKLGFTYLGGMYQARKQFINSAFYFRNHYYNWLAGFKYIAAGYIIGTLVSTFAFGHPYLLEDYIRSKCRGLTTVPFVQRGFQPT
jgi:hypothetical protein